MIKYVIHHDKQILLPYYKWFHRKAYTMSKKKPKSSKPKTSPTKKTKPKCDDGVCPLDKTVTVQTAQESWGAILLRFLRLR